MKRLLFVIVSAFIATTSFATNATESISDALVSNEKAQVEKQKSQPLILQKAADMVKSTLGWHYSHRSHWSHYSHKSHYSSW